jgi:hypothetical protein
VHPVGFVGNDRVMDEVPENLETLAR